MEIFDRLSPSYWWTDPGTTVEGPVPIAFAILLGVVIVVAVVAWIIAPRLAPERRLIQRLIARVARWSIGLAIVGLLLLLFRWQIVPFFSKRIWLVLWTFAVIGGGVYVWYYLRKLYPQRVAAWEESERRRRYLPRPAQTGGKNRRRSRRHR